jgi:multidrug resistance efflux pump
MKSSRIVLVNLVVILLLLVGGAAAFYYYQQSVNYISTDNARIEGQALTISAPAAGRLTEWRGRVGQQLTAGERIGAVAAAGGTVGVTAPSRGTIVQQSAVVNTLIAAGAPLARAYDMDNLWVSANIDETDIDDVSVNQTVDIYIAAFPGTTLTGRVSQIGLATAGTFSMLPTPNTTANYTAVTQVVPVNISVDGYRGLNIIPGMSVSVRIHK